MLKNVEKWPTLLLICLPDGSLVVLPCRTSQVLRSNESIVVFESATGWSTDAAEDHPGRPHPPGHRLRFSGSAQVQGQWGQHLEGAPWVVYAKAVSEAP